MAEYAVKRGASGVVTISIILLVVEQRAHRAPCGFEPECPSYREKLTLRQRVSANQQYWDTCDSDDETDWRSCCARKDQLTLKYIESWWRMMNLEQFQWNPPEMWRQSVDAALQQELENFPHKIVVVDDDPTGTQTVHDIPVFTDWEEESLLCGLTGPDPMFYILTNSRSFSSERTKREHELLARRLERAARKAGVPYLLISRGDSTLRGHYPIETQTLKETLESCGAGPFDGEIIIPFFPEGNRYTIENIHYIAQNNELLPVGESEFAKDPTFGYHESDLRRWIEEKTGGEYRAEEVTCFSLTELRAADYNRMLNKLERVSGFGKVVVNAVSYWDLRSFAVAVMRSIKAGKKFLFRTAAAFPKVIAGIPDKPLLGRSELIEEGNCNGGLIVVGSHVAKTTRQVEKLVNCCAVRTVTFNQHLAVDPGALEREVERALKECTDSIAAGKTTVLMTRRERIDLNTGNKEDELALARRISDALSEIVAKLEVRPAYLVAKGGITSSDIGTKGLGVKKAIVAGQILPGVPVWKLGKESRFENLSYIIFPGNVGDDLALKQIVELLS